MTMGNSTPSFFVSDNLEIYANQYVMEYDRLKSQYYFKSIKEIMQLAHKSTIQYQYFLLHDLLPKEKKIWPKGFTDERSECPTKGRATKT